MRRVQQPEQIPWAGEGWLRLRGASWIVRIDGIEISVGCDMFDPASRPAFWAGITDDPALAVHGADFEATGILQLEAATLLEAVAEVDRRWPRAEGIVKEDGVVVDATRADPDGASVDPTALPCPTCAALDPNVILDKPCVTCGMWPDNAQPGDN